MERLSSEGFVNFERVRVPLLRHSTVQPAWRVLWNVWIEHPSVEQELLGPRALKLFEEKHEYTMESIEKCIISQCAFKIFKRYTPGH